MIGFLLQHYGFSYSCFLMLFIFEFERVDIKCYPDVDLILKCLLLLKIGQVAMSGFMCT